MTIHCGLKTRNDRTVQETEQYLYIFWPLIHRTVQLSWARSQQPVHDASSSCFTVDLRLLNTLPPPISQMDSAVDQRYNTIQILCNLLHRGIVSCLKTSMYRHEPQGLIWFCLCMFYSLSKPRVPLTAIIWLWRDKNLHLCSTEETNSPTSWMPWGSADKH